MISSCCETRTRVKCDLSLPEEGCSSTPSFHPEMKTGCDLPSASGPDLVKETLHRQGSCIDVQVLIHLLCNHKRVCCVVWCCVLPVTETPCWLMDIDAAMHISFHFLPVSFTQHFYMWIALYLRGCDYAWWIFLYEPAGNKHNRNLIRSHLSKTILADRWTKLRAIVRGKTACMMG